MWVRAQTNVFASFMLGILAISVYAYWAVGDAGGVHLIAFCLKPNAFRQQGPIFRKKKFTRNTIQTGELDMKTKQSQSGIQGAILVFSMLLGLGIGWSTTAQAQYPNDNNAQDRARNDNEQNRRDRNWDRYGNYGGSFQLRQTALNAGYNEGLSAGNNDRQNGRQSDFQDSEVYRRATTDYSSRLGDRELYRRYFREAFESGYNAAGYDQADRDDRFGNRGRNNNGNRNRRGRNWDGYGNFGGSAQLRQTALNAGYNEGMKQGQSDRNKRDGNRYEDQSAYRKATKDYSSRLGDREIYRRYFREAYKNGYNDGMNGS
ncbi:MAG: hypothetical protein ABR568_01055 [Pyrinomonadaceae bacterium]